MLTQNSSPSERRRWLRGVLRKSLRWTFRWTWRIGTVVVLIAVLLGSAYIVWTNHRGGKAAERALAALAARGVPGERRPEIAEADNGARFYLAALEVLALPEDLKAKLPVVGWAKWPRHGEGFTAEQVALLREAVSRNAAALDLARRARRLSAFDYGLDANSDLPRTLDVLTGSRRLIHWLRIDSLLAGAEGDLDRATDDYLTALHLAGSLREERHLVVHLVRLSLDALTRVSIEDLLSRCELDDGQLGALAKALDAARGSYDLAEACRGDLRRLAILLADPDRALSEAERQLRQQNRMEREMWGNLLGESDADLGADLFRLSPGPRIVKAGHDAFATLCPGQIQLILVRQVEDVLPVFDQIADPATDIERVLELYEAEDRTGVHTGIPTAARSQFRAIAALTAAVVGLRAEQFRLRTGRWPERLSEVVDPVPSDAYGHPIRMHRHDDGVYVYSIGANGVDDKGLSGNRGEATTGDEDDWSFRLLDPDKRTRPPTITELEGEDPEVSWREMLGKFRPSHEVEN